VESPNGAFPAAAVEQQESLNGALPAADVEATGGRREEPSSSSSLAPHQEVRARRGGGSVTVTGVGAMADEQKWQAQAPRLALTADSSRRGRRELWRAGQPANY